MANTRQHNDLLRAAVSTARDFCEAPIPPEGELVDPFVCDICPMWPICEALTDMVEADGVSLRPLDECVCEGESSSASGKRSSKGRSGCAELATPEPPVLG